jgi:ABC-type phosphate transport system substrate-binding protein
MVFKKLIFRLVTIAGLFSASLFSQENKAVIDYVVIGNEIDGSSITKKQLTSVFKSEKNYWKNGNKVIIVLPSTKNELINSVASQVYKMSVAGMQKFWVGLVFQGNATTPHSCETDEETIKFIEKNKGSIGFVSLKSIEKIKNLVIEVK